MNQKLKIKFVDFWPGFIPEKSYFFDLLGRFEKIELCENPEIIFFSNFGSEHKRYSCFRVFYSAENERPNMFKCDIALTFDYSKNNRHFRLPLFVLYAHQYNIDLRNNSEVISLQTINEWKSRKFCCFVVSNGKSKERVNFFHFLNKKEQIDSGGRFLNNIGGPVEDKIKYISNYKFVIAFENSIYPGYTTEKILEPLIVNSIPIYWGNDRIGEDFSENCFINANRIDFEEVYSKMKTIENNDHLISTYLQSERINSANLYLEEKKVRDFILDNYRKRNNIKANSIFYKFLGGAVDYIKIFNYWLIHYTKGHFR